MSRRHRGQCQLARGRLLWQAHSFRFAYCLHLSNSPYSPSRTLTVSVSHIIFFRIHLLVALHCLSICFATSMCRLASFVRSLVKHQPSLRITFAFVSLFSPISLFFLDRFRSLVTQPGLPYAPTHLRAPKTLAIARLPLLLQHLFLKLVFVWWRCELLGFYSIFTHAWLGVVRRVYSTHGYHPHTRNHAATSILLFFPFLIFPYKTLSIQTDIDRPP